MSFGSGSTKDMNDGRAEGMQHYINLFSSHLDPSALHALLNSLSPEASGSQNVKQ